MKKNPRTVIDVSQDHTFKKPGDRKSVPRTLDAKRLKSATPKYRWVKDKPDNRDYLYKVTSKPVPNFVDLRKYCTPIENQEYLGSCTGQAIAGAIELLNNRNQKRTDVSRLYIYYHERVLLGTVDYDSGAYIRDGIKVTNKKGAPLEHLWPYDIKKFRLKPSMIAEQDASKRKVTLYERVLNFDGCIDALVNGYPVVIGFYVYSSFESPLVRKTGIMPYPNIKTEKKLGGHAVLLVGYDKQKEHFIVRNSWGTTWGDKGYFYMPFKVIQNPEMSEDFWIIKSVNNP